MFKPAQRIILAVALCSCAMGAAISASAAAGGRNNDRRIGAQSSVRASSAASSELPRHQAQPQQITIIMPQPAPAPPPQPPAPAAPISAAARVSIACGDQWYPLVKTCADKWQIAIGGPYPMFVAWCPHFQQWAPAVQSCRRLYARAVGVATLSELQAPRLRFANLLWWRSGLVEHMRNARSSRRSRRSYRAPGGNRSGGGAAAGDGKAPI